MICRGGLPTNPGSTVGERPFGTVEERRFGTVEYWHFTIIEGRPVQRVEERRFSAASSTFLVVIPGLRSRDSGGKARNLLLFFCIATPHFKRPERIRRPWPRACPRVTISAKKTILKPRIPPSG